MPETIRELIIDALEDALAAITIGNGFETDVRRVFRAGESTLHVPEWPALLIVDEGDDKSPARLDAAYIGVMTLRIKGFLKQPDEGQKPIDISRLQGDIIRKIEENPHFDGLADQTRAVTEAPNMAEAFSPQGLALVTVAIRYTTVQNDPTKVQPRL